MTNNAGTVSDTYDYEAFGNLVSATGTTPNDYLYSGERFDSDLGAYHLRERDYNPQRGRFLTSDPFAGFTDEPQSLHKYLYVGTDPVNYIDPSGFTETTEHPFNIVRLNVRTKLNCVMTLVEWLADAQDLLQLARDWHGAFPEWQGIDPDRTPVRYVPPDEVREIRRLPGEYPGHHPHPLSLGGPPGQILTRTGETLKWKHPFHKAVSKLQNDIVRHIKGKLCL